VNFLFTQQIRTGPLDPATLHESGNMSVIPSVVEGSRLVLGAQAKIVAHSQALHSCLAGICIGMTNRRFSIV
jgi:hypothetical protein